MPGSGVPPTPGVYLGNQGPLPTIAYPTAKRSRSWGGYLMTLIILGAVGVGSWAVYKTVSKATGAANDAINQGNEVSDPHLSSNDRNALGLSGDEQFLYDGAAAAAITTALDNGIAGQPTAFTQIGLYGDYAIATAQNPSLPDHLDQYMWRTGSLGTASPQPSDAAAPTMTFTVDEIDWTAVSAVVANAATLSKVEQGEVSYVVVQRDTFTADLPVVVRIYVNGPRGSAYIQVAADGTVVNVF